MKVLFIGILCLHFVIKLSAQAVIGNRIIWKNHILYPDAKLNHLYYVIPGRLILKRDDRGKPDFQLTQMRYRGTACRGDKVESRFFNLLRFSVEINASAQIDMQNFKAYFGHKSQLVSLPIRHISTNLITSVSGVKNARVIRLANNGIVESGLRNKHEFWKERSYTMKLQNHEAEIIAKQIAENSLALSLAYSFFADGILGDRTEINIEGDQESVAELMESLDSTFIDPVNDTLVQPFFVFSDAFPIEIDTNAWSGLIKKIDLNDEVPPDYPAIEVRCYDFNEQLNPDQFMKKIEVKSTSVNGRAIEVSTKFYKKTKDVIMTNIYFPFAIKMDAPIQYRITSYSENGDRIKSGWKSTQSCTAMIDITESNTTQIFAKEELEIELNSSLFDSLNIEEIQLKVEYSFKDKYTNQIIKFKAADASFYKSIYYWKDTSSATKIIASFQLNNGNQMTYKLKIPSDHYLYLTLNSLE